MFMSSARIASPDILGHTAPANIPALPFNSRKNYGPLLKEDY
jgi:hypothetical protein